MKRLLILIMLTGCAGTLNHDVKNLSPLTGIWTYNNCSIKNTSVNGTAEFRDNGELVLKIKARDDYPVKNNFSGKYKYFTEGNRIKTDYPGGYGIDEYFLIEGEYLYFSGTAIDRLIEEPEKYRYNWTYKLKRKK